MTDGPPDLTERQLDVLATIHEQHPETRAAVADAVGVAETTVRNHLGPLRDAGCIPPAARHEPYVATDRGVDALRAAGRLDDDEAFRWCDETVGVDDQGDGEDDAGAPSLEDLSDRQQHILRSISDGGAASDELAADLDVPERVVDAHITALQTAGWEVYHDDTTDAFVIEGDHSLRSSEHTGTRTRKANRWWELRHSALVREFRALDHPTADLPTRHDEDWVLHLTDVHVGDRVRNDAGKVIYDSETAAAVVDHVAERALDLAAAHGQYYDVGHLVLGGDFITNEGIYEGQFEDLDAWLDEQHDTIIDPLVRMVKAFADRFPAVQVVCQVGNHGDHRANGTSRQANADLILYKTLRNTIATIREHTDGLLQNVEFRIGEAKPYRNFPLRGGRLKGHVRHGQHAKPQAATAAGKRDWRGWVLDHDFDVGMMGHHHVSGRIPWDGPPVICTGSPKPAGDFVESLGGRSPRATHDIATAFGVSDRGLTAVFPIDTRHFDR
jgi:DNA-binding CsgD family transcriptional regulator